MVEEDVKAIIEALIFAAGEDGLSSKDLSNLTDLPQSQIESLIQEMRINWKEQKRGVQILKTAQVYKITTLPDHREYIQKLVSAPIGTKLSRALLETLAIVAYKQPITRLDLEEIRGVKSERTLQLLQRKGLVKMLGRSSDIGRPILYGTTEEFLDYFGINSLKELPSPKIVFESKEREEEKKYLFEKLGID